MHYMGMWKSDCYAQSVILSGHTGYLAQVPLVKLLEQYINVYL